MIFQENGYLAPGFHDWTIEQTKDALVKSFPESTSRTVIMEGYDKLRALFHSFGIECEHWIDGSYCSTKIDPKDIDLVVAADFQKVNELPRIGQQLWKSLVSGPATKVHYSCDSYFLPTVPANHPLEKFCEERRSYWTKQFGNDRQGVAKGVVRIKLVANSSSGNRS